MHPAAHPADLAAEGAGVPVRAVRGIRGGRPAPGAGGAPPWLRRDARAYCWLLDSRKGIAVRTIARRSGRAEAYVRNEIERAAAFDGAGLPDEWVFT